MHVFTECILGYLTGRKGINRINKRMGHALERFVCICIPEEGIAWIEAEAGEFFLRGGGIVEDEAAPAVAGEADEAAAGAVENRQIGGREGGVFGAEGHADVEPIDAGFIARREIDGEVGAGRG